jgi:hypothetical protein
VYALSTSSLTPSERLYLLFSQMSKRFDQFAGDKQEFAKIISFIESKALPGLKEVIADLEGTKLGARKALEKAVLTLEGMCAIPIVNGFSAVWETVREQLLKAQDCFEPLSTSSRLRVWLVSTFS